MQAYVHTNAKGNITIQLKGGLDYENGPNFKREIESLVGDHPSSIITLDMYFLDFVGSSGIGAFVETIRIMNKDRMKVKLANVKSEFLKVFKLYNFPNMETTIVELAQLEVENASKSFKSLDSRLEDNRD